MRLGRDAAAPATAFACVLLCLCAASARGASVPNDPYFARQWGSENTGQAVPAQELARERLGAYSPGTPGADDGASRAWSLTTGSPSIVIGEVDTGVDYEHPDLGANVWINPGGVGECAPLSAGCSPGGNCEAGTRGFDVINGSCEALDEDKSYGGHGTHVAGIMGAVGNNAEGVAGVNWRTTILPVKWLDDANPVTEPSAKTLAAALHAISTARQAGVNVRLVNDSATFRGMKGTAELREAIEQLGAEGVLFVTAAGNNGLNQENERTYPCSFGLANEICVTATNDHDELPAWANYGAQFVQLAAPGESIFSTLAGGPGEANYGYLSGTSMAAAEVSGAAALILSQHETMSVSELRTDILQSVDPLPALAGKVSSGGRLDVCNAIPGCNPAVAGPVRAPVSPPAKTPQVPAPPVAHAQIVALSLHPAAFRAARKGPTISPAGGEGGTTIRYYDSEPALTRFTVLAARTGVVNAAGRCVAPPRAGAAAGKHPKHCARYVAVAHFYRRDTAGANSFHFSGRIAPVRLAPGRYRLALAPSFDSQAAATVETSFRVIS
ncbi:MAG TPA: S8 family serine peptidase [Solirubrobacteraceae bacterium]|jgi:subtilisin family serine protease|nr:S8 family serine peptidase [Solirubrobacteraceae bacterium]